MYETVTVASQYLTILTNNYAESSHSRVHMDVYGVVIINVRIYASNFFNLY